MEEILLGLGFVVQQESVEPVYLEHGASFNRRYLAMTLNLGARLAEFPKSSPATALLNLYVASAPVTTTALARQIGVAESTASANLSNLVLLGLAEKIGQGSSAVFQAIPLARSEARVELLNRLNRIGTRPKKADRDDLKQWVSSESLVGKSSSAILPNEKVRILFEASNQAYRSGEDHLKRARWLMTQAEFQTALNEFELAGRFFNAALSGSNDPTIGNVLGYVNIISITVDKGIQMAAETNFDNTFVLLGEIQNESTAARVRLAINGIQKPGDHQDVLNYLTAIVSPESETGFVAIAMGHVRQAVLAAEPSLRGLDTKDLERAITTAALNRANVFIRPTRQMSSAERRSALVQLLNTRMREPGRFAALKTTIENEAELARKVQTEDFNRSMRRLYSTVLEEIRNPGGSFTKAGEGNQDYRIKVNEGRLILAMVFFAKTDRRIYELFAAEFPSTFNERIDAKQLRQVASEVARRDIREKQGLTGQVEFLLSSGEWVKGQPVVVNAKAIQLREGRSLQISDVRNALPELASGARLTVEAVSGEKITVSLVTNDQNTFQARKEAITQALGARIAGQFNFIQTSPSEAAGVLKTARQDTFQVGNVTLTPEILNQTVDVFAGRLTQRQKQEAAMLDFSIGVLSGVPQPVLVQTLRSTSLQLVRPSSYSLFLRGGVLSEVAGTRFINPAEITGRLTEAIASAGKPEQAGSFISIAMAKAWQLLGNPSAVSFEANAALVANAIREAVEVYYDRLLAPVAGAPSTYSMYTDSTILTGDYYQELQKLNRRVKQVPGLIVNNVLVKVDPKLAGNTALQQNYRRERGLGFDEVLFISDRGQIARLLNTSNHPAVFLTKDPVTGMRLEKGRAIAVQLKTAGDRYEGILGNAWTQSLKLRMTSGVLLLAGIKEILPGIYEMRLISEVLMQILRQEKERMLAVGTAA